MTDLREIYPRFMLAPLAGYTDKAFRQIAHECGAEASVTEMVSAEGLARGSDKTELLLDRFPGEDNLIVQLFAPSADPVERCIPALMRHNPAAIDINCGCPVPKVVKTGAGSALMKTPERMAEIVRTLKRETGLPVSVKFRLGWDSSSICFMDFADAAYDAGASMLTLHAKTRAAGYSGTADRQAFRTLSDHMNGKNVLLFASGDIFTPEDAEDIIRNYGMDGVMFARGAIGNPFIFRMSSELFSTGSYRIPTIEEKVDTAIRHLHLATGYYGENTACREMRKHLMAYIKGIRGANKVKAEISQALTERECVMALKKLLEETPEEK